MSDQHPPYGPPPGQPSYGPPPIQPPPGPPPGAPAGQPPAAPPTPAPGLPPTPPPPGGWDYAQFGGGPQSPKPRNTRKWLLGAGGVVVAAAIVGGGAFAAASILGGDKDLGPQPAEALPSSVFAYASIDLDPSDGEKGEAIKTLLKFPAVQKQIKLGQGDDLRQKIVDSIIADDPDTCGGLTWEKDFEPWLGTKAAVAGVAVSGKPTPVAVIQVSDEDKARAEFDKLKKCDGGDTAGVSIAGGWALVGESQDTISELAADAKTHSLADDESYRKWTGEVGDPGAVMMYAAPSAGDMLAKAFEQSMVSMDSAASGSGSAMASPSAYSSSLRTQDDGPLGDFCPGADGDPGAAIDQFKSGLQGFQGGAATVRFKDEGVEFESAMDLGQAGTAGKGAGDMVGSLPDDTAAAVGISLGDGWFDTVLTRLADVCGPGFDASAVERQLSQLTGLTFPDDIDTLLGKGVALSLGSGFDPSSLASPADLPVALSFKGDSTAIKAVLDKIRARIGNADEGFLDSDAKGDTTVVGPSSSYRSKVLGAGGLGGDSTFTDVVPHASDASMVLYVDFDEFDHLVGEQAGSEALANFKPLKALGMSGWLDGTTTHSFARLSTD